MPLLRRFAGLVALASSFGCGDSLPDLFPGAYPDDRRVTAAADGAPGLVVDVLTFNIKYASDGEDYPWRDRRVITRDLLRDQHPDVIALQEALRSQLDDLGPPEPYREIAAGRDDGLSGGEHAAILYRSDRFVAREEGTFWLSPTPSVPGSAGWGNRISRTCAWVHLVEKSTERGVYVFNTHLDNQSQSSRALGIELIAQRIASRSSTDPVVVMGDFNAVETNAAVQYLLGRTDRASEGTAPTPPSPRLLDAFRAVHPTASEAGTFHRWSGATTGRRIDFILPSAPARVLDAAILRARRDGIYPSDHFPVRARLWFPIPALAPP